MKPNKPTQFEKTAIHEAGHAMMLCHFNLPFHKATIVPTKDYLGAVVGENLKRSARRLNKEAFGNLPDKSHPFYEELKREQDYIETVPLELRERYLEESILVLFGGMVAEELFFDKYGGGYLSDQSIISDYQARLFIEDPTFLFDRTKEILSGYKTEVVALANLLLREKTISGTMARRLLSELELPKSDKQE